MPRWKETFAITHGPPEDMFLLALRGDAKHRRLLEFLGTSTEGLTMAARVIIARIQRHDANGKTFVFYGTAELSGPNERPAKVRGVFTPETHAGTIAVKA